MIARSRQPESKQRMRVALFLACFLITGCTTAQRANFDDATCQAQGAKFGTRDYVQCRATLEAARQH